MNIFLLVANNMASTVNSSLRGAKIYFWRQSNPETRYSLDFLNLFQEKPFLWIAASAFSLLAMTVSLVFIGFQPNFI
jgi:hypothetical protein